MGMMYNTTVSAETHLTSMISRGQNLEQGFFFSQVSFQSWKNVYGDCEGLSKIF